MIAIFMNGICVNKDELDYHFKINANIFKIVPHVNLYYSKYW